MTTPPLATWQPRLLLFLQAACHVGRCRRRDAPPRARDHQHAAQAPRPLPPHLRHHARRQAAGRVHDHARRAGRHARLQQEGPAGAARFLSGWLAGLRAARWVPRGAGRRRRVARSTPRAPHALRRSPHRLFTDLAWLEQQRDVLVSAGAIGADAVALADVTDEIEILHLAGPRSTELMAALCPQAARTAARTLKERRLLSPRHS